MKGGSIIMADFVEEGGKRKIGMQQSSFFVLYNEDSRERKVSERERGKSQQHVHMVNVHDEKMNKLKELQL